MTEQYTFNTFSFFSGMLAGMIIKWTDIIPILGGFALGLSVKKLPEFINYNDLPAFVRKYLDYFTRFTTTEEIIPAPERRKKTS